MWLVTDDLSEDALSNNSLGKNGAETAPIVSSRPGASRASLGGIRVLTVLAAIFVAAVLAVAIMVGLTLFLPGSSQAVWVQFSELEGRVQLGYCPSLAGTFEGTALTRDLDGSSDIVPVKVSAEECGNAIFADGVWLYLHRASVTIASTAR
jgi:hypothetical protein